jgi:hypothetical protein
MAKLMVTNVKATRSEECSTSVLNVERIAKGSIQSRSLIDTQVANRILDEH